MAYVQLDSSILDLPASAGRPDDGDPWSGMSYQEIRDAQAAQVDAWNAQLAAEIERREQAEELAAEIERCENETNRKKMTNRERFNVSCDVL